MKLKTSDILPVVIDKATLYSKERWPFPEEAEEEGEYIYEDENGKLMEHPWIAATLKKRWKRVEKSKLETYCQKYYFDVGQFTDDGWEFVDVLDDETITEKCILRHFVNDVLSDGLDAYVITDPTDSKILRINWHSD